MTSRSCSPLTAEDLVAGERARRASRRGSGRDGNNAGGGHEPRIYGTDGGPPAYPRPCSLGRVPVEQVLLAEPRGFCAGVEMAIKALAWMVRVFEPPVYCYHEIVHNRLVVDRFREQGVIFVDDVDEVPGRRAAHALGPRLGARGRRRGPGRAAATS